MNIWAIMLTSFSIAILILLISYQQKNKNKVNPLFVGTCFLGVGIIGLGTVLFAHFPDKTPLAILLKKSIILSFIFSFAMSVYCFICYFTNKKTPIEFHPCTCLSCFYNHISHCLSSHDNYVKNKRD